MTKSLLAKIMNKNYNLPNITALVHATLLVFFMAGFIVCGYVIMAPELTQKADSGNFGIFFFHQYFWYNWIPLLIAFGILAGLNEMVYFLLFRLRKKAAAYSMSALVLALQIAVIGSGLTIL